MKDFKNMTESELKNILTFTEAVANAQLEKKANFSEMKTTDESLLDAEREATQFAERRKVGQTARSTFGESTDEQAEIDEIRASIRDYYKRTRKVVKG